MIIGSRALKYWFPDFYRAPKDFDIIRTNKDLEDLKYLIKHNKQRIEYLYNPILSENIALYSKDNYILPDVLYTLKISHMFWDNPKWDTHFQDIMFMKDKNCKLDIDLFYKLFEYWEIFHGKRKSSNLNMNSEQFFNNALKNKIEYEHDLLHTLLVNPPTYTKILMDGEEVLVSYDKFKLLSESEKISLVKEEVMVMAWERYYLWPYRKAYYVMLKKFIMNHAPLWESLFILDNLKKIYNPGFNFIDHINNNLIKIPKKNVSNFTNS